MNTLMAYKRFDWQANELSREAGIAKSRYMH